MPIQPSSTPILNVPNVYVNIVPPAAVLSGVSTNLIGIVGSANWGAINAPIVFGGMQEGIQTFGTPQPVMFDLMTAAYLCNLQGANNIVGVRVTDGTDSAAVGSILDTQSFPPNSQLPGAYLTALYTGDMGDNITATISYGSSYTPGLPTFSLRISLAGGIPEVFDNLVGTLSEPGSIWQNLVSAVNNGQSVSRGPSRLVVASLSTGAGDCLVSDGGAGYTEGDILTVIGGIFTEAAQITVDTVVSGSITNAHVSRTGQYSQFPIAQPVDVSGGTGSLAKFEITQGTTYVPAIQQFTLSGGTNGNNPESIDTATLIGVDGLTRTGMYALRGTKANIVMLADASDSTYYTDQIAFSYSEGLPYMVGTLPAGYQDDLQNAVILKQTSGSDAYIFKLMLGDWCQINDPYNNLTRFVSPQAFVCGVLANIRADGSSLNKQVLGVIATQKSLEGRRYSDADLSLLRTGGLDLITLGIPASDSAFGVRLGINTSTNNQTNTDNYPRMINFLGNTLLYGMAPYIGRTQTPDTRLQAKNAIQSFLAVLASSTLSGGAMIGDVNRPGDISAAFKVILDATNNPMQQVALGFMQCDVQVVLFSIIQYLVVNLDAAQNITIQALPPQVNQ